MKTLTLLALAASTALIGCASGGNASTASNEVPGVLPSSGAVVATVYGVEISEGTITAALAGLTEEQRAQATAPENATQLHQQMAREGLLYKAAIEAGTHNTEAAKTRMVLAERDALIQLHLQNIVDAEMTDEKLREWYDAHLVQFRVPQAHVKLILSPNEEESRAAFAQLEAGTDFSEVASNHSMHQESAVRGGDLDWVVLQGFPEDVRGLVEAAEPGGLIGPSEIAGQGVWQILQVLERREVVPFEEVKPMLAADESMKNEIVEEYLNGLITAADPEGAADAAAAAMPPSPHGAPAGDDHGHEHGEGDGHDH